MAELPSQFYGAIGVLVASNLAVLGSLVVLIFKGGMFVAETRGNIREAKDTAVRAHVRIDKLEERIDHHYGGNHESRI